MYTKDTVQSLLSLPVTSEKKHVLIFHCEFSSERGPKMHRFLRSQDRDLNKDSYPALNFPEVYLLDGGYKAFYGQCMEQCYPASYKPMLHMLMTYVISGSSLSHGPRAKHRRQIADFGVDFRDIEACISKLLFVV